MVKYDISSSSVRYNNPHWEGRKLIDYKFIERDVLQDILNSIREYRLILITGPLGVGKTSLLYQIIDRLSLEVNPSNILYVPIDDPSQVPESVGSFYFNEVSKSDRDPIYIILDEFLFMEEYLDYLKQLINRGENIHIILASSYKPKKLDGLGIEYREFTLKPLSFSEFLRLVGYDFSNVPFDQYKVRDFYIEHLNLSDVYMAYLYRGGYPRLTLDMDSRFVRGWVKNNVLDRILYKLIPRIGRKRRPQIAESLFRLICFEPGEAVNYNRLSESVDKDIRTVTTYISTLENAYLINILKHMVDKGKAGRKLPKIYPYNPSYAYSLYPERFNNEVYLNTMVESQLIQQLDIKYYIRRSSGVDVLIWEHGDMYIPIYVKFVRRISKRDVKRVQNIASKLGSKYGFVLVRETLEFHREDGIDTWVIPAWLFQLIDFDTL